MASRGGVTGRPVTDAKKEVYTRLFEAGASDRARLAHAVEEAEIDRRAAEELANIGRMRKGFVKSDDPAAASGIDPEVALYYRKKMLPKSLPGLWDKMMKRVYAAGAKLSIAVVAVVFSGMLACAIVIAVIVANWPREAVHHFFLENHARALAGLPETTYKEALRQARYLPWGGPQPRCSAARDALMSGGNVAAALASAEGDAYGAGAGGGGGGGGVSDAGAVGEESARRSLLRQRRALLSRGAGAWRTDELDPEEWAGLLLPSAESRRAMLDFLYSRAVTCPFRTKDCTSNAKVSSAMPDVPLGSWGSCAIVGRDAALLGANYADFIDAHDTVFRFAASARPGYEKYVGRKTDVTYLDFDCQAAPDPPSAPPELHPDRLWLLEDKGRSPRQRGKFDCVAEQRKFLPPPGARRTFPPPPPPAAQAKAAQASKAAEAAPAGEGAAAKGIKQSSLAAKAASIRAGSAPEAGGNGWGRRRSLLKDHHIPGVSSGDERLDNWRAKAHHLVKKKRKPLPPASQGAAPAQGGAGAAPQLRSLPGAPSCDSVFEQSLMKPPYCKHDWSQGWLGKPVLLSEHSPPTLEPSPSTNDRQHMRDFSAALLAKVVELSPGMADVDNTADDVLEMSQEMFFTMHLLYSGLCTSVDLFGLPQYPGGATYYGERTRKGYAPRLETTLARLLETNLTLCVFDGFDGGRA